MKKLIHRIMWVCIVSMHLSHETWASGYHPPFDHALKQAELVIQGDVVESWNALGNENSGKFSKERAYRMVVGKCFKGTLNPGDEIYFWDPHYHSTASYQIRENSTYICYLVPAKMSEFEVQKVIPKGKRYYKPIRARRKISDPDPPSSLKDYYTSELKLLDLFVENPPANKREAYQRLLAEEAYSELLRCVVKDWPRPLTEKDIAVFKKAALDSVGYSSYTSIMLSELVRFPSDVFSDAEIHSLLLKGGSDRLSVLKPLINANNIEGLQELLFKWIQEMDAGGAIQQVIKTLAEYAPDYFKEQLKAHELPFWKLIPSLVALNINGSDIGKEDFSDELMKLSLSDLYQVSKFLDGDQFWAWIILNCPARHPEWKTALPLLEPMLKGPDSPNRRLAVTLFRTFGISVKRSKDVYKAEFSKPSVPCPVRLELMTLKSQIMLGQPVKLFLKEHVVTNGGDFSFCGEAIFSIHFENHWDSPSLPNPRTWNDVKLPPEEFVVLVAGMEKTSEYEISSRRMDRPGTYRVSAMKCYSHDGFSVGLDAWAGMAFSENEITIEVMCTTNDIVTSAD